MIILSVDLGLKRTGIAVCDRNETLASPVCVIQEADSESLARQISEIALERDAEEIVLGLPKNMDGTEGESAKNARGFSKILERTSHLPVRLQDERGTTITASKYLNETNTRGKKRKSVLDAVSAVIILEDYLRYKKLNCK